MDTSLYKDKKTTRGLIYHYLRIVAQGAKPTLLFLHGFPSTSDDWEHQVAYFKSRGYGLIVPDLLGCGGTSKPLDPKEFRMSLMAADIVEILDAEQIEKVVVIGHDWGCALVSRLSMLYPQRCHGLAWLALAYTEPTPSFRLDDIMAHMRNTVGYEVFGYWKFFEKEDAASKIENHMDSFIDLLYPKDHKLWRTVLTIPGKSEEWVVQGQRSEIASYLTPEHHKKLGEILLKDGMSSRLNWYKAALGDYNREDNLAIPKEKWTIQNPTFFGAALNDLVCLPGAGKVTMEKYAKNLKVVDFDCGHWVQLEQPDKLNEELENWMEGLSFA